MHRLLVGLIALISVQAYAGVGPNGSGNELRTYCNHKEADANSDVWLGCVLYVQGIVDGRMNAIMTKWDPEFILAVTDDQKHGVEYLSTFILNQYCFPENVTRNQVALVVTKYLDDHPQELDKDSSDLVVEALHNAWPCKSNAKSKP